MVWYQVFPERFRNGNPENDPAGWDLMTVDWDQPLGVPTDKEIEAHWFRVESDPRRYRSNPDRLAGAGMDTIFERRYGGDLQGVYEKLEDLAAMGVTGIYLCPVFESRSLHKYDAWDHRHIDPTLGHPGKYSDPGPIPASLAESEDPADETTWVWTPADTWFVEVFLPKAKSLGLRVVLDGVWNHVGLGHFGFSDVREHGIGSRFTDWFETRFNEEGQLIGWKSWNGVNGHLPVFRQIEGDLAPGPKAHIMAVTRRWMDPNGDGDPSDGIDGWRLDVANEVGRRFWKDWRAEVRRINPEALIIGEIWFDAKDYFDGTAFDGQMNYPAAYVIADWLSIGGPIKGDARVAADRLRSVFHHDRAHDLVQFNLMSSHDTERLASLMMNDTERGFDNAAKPWDGGSIYDDSPPDLDAMQRSLMAYATLVAMPGSVMIYNGDEYAMPGADDPLNRAPILWDQHRKWEQKMFFSAVGDLLRYRSDPVIGPVLREGSVEWGSENDGRTLLIRRTLGGVAVEIRITPDFAVDLSPGVNLGLLDGWLNVKVLEG
ncbi:MAG: hypothetical protein KC996_01570 [Phycisphaerales bacterium]|nr:hypothetical protein [Phycisphaerales bacterium]